MSIIADLHKEHATPSSEALSQYLHISGQNIPLSSFQGCSKTAYIQADKATFTGQACLAANKVLLYAKSISLGTTFDLKIYSQSLQLFVTNITIGPHIRIVEGSIGYLNCHTVTLITKEDGSLSKGQKLLKSWVNTDAIVKLIRLKTPL